MFAYQVCECTSCESPTAAVMVRSVDRIRSAAFACGIRGSSSECAVAPRRGSPMQCTSTSSNRRNSRTRKSTCTPAPPYTSGGNSRVRMATFITSDDRSSRRVRSDPEPQLPVSLVLQLTTGGLDHLARRHVVRVAGDQCRVDPELGTDRQGLDEHLGRVAAAAGRGAHAVPDVPADLQQLRAQLMADGEPA